MPAKPAQSCPGRSALDVALVGAGGAVGREILGCLERRSFPLGRLGVFGSGRSSGGELEACGRELRIEEPGAGALKDHDLVFLAAGRGASEAYARPLARGGAVVIDSSSALRGCAEVPLVVPEVNGELLEARPHLVASPNCTTTLAVLAVAPLHRAFGVRRLSVASYQAVSGIGAAGISELRAATRAALEGREVVRGAFAEGIAFNLIPVIGALDEEGWSGEERKMLTEARKILDHQDLEVSCTCVRVPVPRVHTLAMTVELAERAAPEEVAGILRAAPGIELRGPEPPAAVATPRELVRHEEVVVTRLHPVFEDGRSFALVAMGDQLLKGAALNAVQIAERLFGIQSSSEPAS